MKTKIEKINGKNKLIVQYKSQVFIVQCDPKDVNYFKNNIDIMINRFKADLLDEYNSFLLKENYCDTDIICEHPTALDQFLIFNKDEKAH